jgi:uncharacterized delta-60 repeat protein
MTTVTNPSAGTLFFSGYGYSSKALTSLDGQIYVAQGKGFSVATLNSNGYPISTNEEIYSFGGGNVDLGGLVRTSDGSFFIGGYGQEYSSGPVDFIVLKFLSNGKIDTNYGVSGKVKTDFKANSYGFDLLIQSDQKIIQIGQVNLDFALARYNLDGSLDASFGNNGKVITNVLLNDSAKSGTLQADGKILVVGYALDPITSTIILALLRYNPDGTLDTNFDGDGKATTYFGTQSVGVGVVVQNDGKIVCAAEGENFMLARFNINGTLDTSFGVAGKVITRFPNYANATDITIQKDGKFLVCGALHNRDGNDLVLARYNVDGSLDTTFDEDGMVVTNLGGNDYPMSITLQDDGKILVSGVGSASPSASRLVSLTRYNVNGSLDTSFNGMKPMPAVTTEKHNLSVIVEKGVLNFSAVLLKGLTETITLTAGAVTKHTVEYSGLTFDYNAIDSLITTVTRDDEFTTEFRKELTDAAPSTVNLTYKDAVTLVGVVNIDSILINLAGLDGSFVN